MGGCIPFIFSINWTRTVRPQHSYAAPCLISWEVGEQKGGQVMHPPPVKLRQFCRDPGGSPFRPRLLGEPQGVAAKSRSVVGLPFDVVGETIYVDDLEEGQEDGLFVSEVGDLFHGLGPCGAFGNGVGFRLPGLEVRAAMATAAAEAAETGVVKSLHVQDFVGRGYFVGVGGAESRTRGSRSAQSIACW